MTAKDIFHILINPLYYESGTLSSVLTTPRHQTINHNLSVYSPF